MSTSYDILVIGGGPAGYSAAIHAAKQGSKNSLRIGIVESRQLGGTCLNRGCIPTKTLLDTAGILDSLADAPKRGIELCGNASVDMKKVLQFKNRVVKKMNMGVGVLLRENSVPVIQGTAKVESTEGGFRVSVTNGDKTGILTTMKLILATGSEPTRIPLAGLDDPDISQRILTSDELLDLDFVPEKLLILGGGVIGVEAARIFRSFGSDVHIVEALPRLLPFVDTEIVSVLTKSLNGRKIKVSTGVQATAVEKTESGIALLLADGQRLEASHLLLSVGRSPNTSILSDGLKSSLKLDRRGFISVDHWMKTSVPGLFAPGDVNGLCMLAHAAIEMGRLAATAAVEELIPNLDDSDTPDESAIEEFRRRILEKPNHSMLPSLLESFFPFYVPGCVYGEPEIGYIGWTEEQAKDKLGDRIRIGRFPFGANGRAAASGQQEGFVKVIRFIETETIVGVHIIGPCASELINEVSAIMYAGGNVDQWAASIHAHPTYGEALVEAAADSLGTALHLPPK